MGRRRTTALVVGVLLLLPGLGLLVAGGSLGLARLAEGRDGYLSQTLDPVRSGSAAVVSPDVGVVVDAGVPRWLLDRLDLDVRLRAVPLDGSRPLFVGIGPTADVERYLDGAAHDRVTRVDGTRVLLEPVTGGAAALPAPASQSFWVASARGPGGAQVDWTPAAGSYSLVVMNADGTPGVGAEVVAAGRAGFLTPLALLLLVVGGLVTAAAVVLLVRSTRGGGPTAPTAYPGWADTPAAANHGPSDRR